MLFRSSLDRGEGERVVETLETNMKQPYVRIERIFKKNLDGKLLAQGEVAMVANQVMLQRPETLEPQAMDKILREAGAREVRDLGNDSFLATFDARPEDPLALDGYLKQVKEVAGADVPVEPNYIRKLF